MLISQIGMLQIAKETTDAERAKDALVYERFAGQQSVIEQITQQLTEIQRLVTKPPDVTDVARLSSL